MKDNKKYVAPFTEVNTYLTRNNICIEFDPNVSTNDQLGKDNGIEETDEVDLEEFNPNLWGD